MALVKWNVTLKMGEQKTEELKKLNEIERELEERLLEEEEIEEIADTLIDVKCDLIYRQDGKTKFKRATTEAALSERLSAVLARLVSQSKTLRTDYQHLGQLFLGETRQWFLLKYSTYGQQTIFEMEKQQLLLVFDLCGWMEAPLLPDSQWPVLLSPEQLISS